MRAVVFVAEEVYDFIGTDTVLTSAVVCCLAEIVRVEGDPRFAIKALCYDTEFCDSDVSSSTSETFFFVCFPPDPRLDIELIYYIVAFCLLLPFDKTILFSSTDYSKGGLKCGVELLPGIAWKEYSFEYTAFELLSITTLAFEEDVAVADM